MREFKEGDLLYAADLNALTEAIQSAQQQVSEATKQTYTDELERDLREAIGTKATSAEVQDLIAQIPPTNLSGLATEDYVNAQILQAELSGNDEPIDLSPFALKADLATKVDIVQGKGLSTTDFTNAEKEKLSGIEAGAQKNPDLSMYALKTDLRDATQITINGEVISGLKKFVFEVDAVDGTWFVDYADKGFTRFVNVDFYSIANGTGTADRTIPTLKQGQPTLTSCEGYLMSATSAGLLAAMTLVNASGKVRVTVEGV